MTGTDHIGERFILADVQSADVVSYRIAVVPDEVVTRLIRKSIDEDRVKCLCVVRLRYVRHVLLVLTFQELISSKGIVNFQPRASSTIAEFWANGFRLKNRSP